MFASQGYVLYSLRKKLKAELVGRSQEEIKELRLAGQEVTDTYQVTMTGCLLLARRLLPSGCSYALLWGLLQCGSNGLTTQPTI